MTNPLDFLIRRSPIAGLEISETAIRIALISMTDGKTPTIGVKAMAEEALPAGVVTNGEVTDVKQLTAVIKKLVSSSKLTTKYVIVSIPGEQAYTRIFSFPETISGDKLETSMNLTIGFHLPVKPDDVYLDWEKLEGEEKANKEIFLATMSKKIVDGFLEAVNAAGLKTTAVELHEASFVRVANIGNEPVLIKRERQGGTNFSVIKNRIPHFTRFVPNSLSEDILDKETLRVRNFYEFEHGTISDTLNYDKLSCVRNILPEATDDESRWLIALGAAARGLLPRSEDTLVSLMPLGTETAYEYQKLAAFSELLTNSIVGVAIFFAVAYLGVWALMISLQVNAVNALQGASIAAIPTDSAGLEARANDFNARVGQLAGIARTIPRWSIAVEMIGKYLDHGVVINSLNMPSPAASFSITGVASTREALKIFTKSLEESEYFTGVVVPLTGASLRANIPFSATFMLKDPQSLYQY
jgi:Tfp pilus assembly protein PilN